MVLKNELIIDRSSETAHLKEEHPLFSGCRKCWESLPDFEFIYMDATDDQLQEVTISFPIYGHREIKSTNYRISS